MKGTTMQGIPPVQGTPQAQDPLAQLRDIHWPDPISAWPPAPGWWLLAALIIAAVTAMAVYAYRHYRNNTYRRLALKALMQLKQQADNHCDNNQHYLQQLNTLLKQTALAANATPDVAALSGRRWLEFLDNSAQTKAFSEGVGHVLLDGPYKPTLQSVDFDQLYQLIQHWIKRHRIPC